jgi:hypothetical protein
VANSKTAAVDGSKYPTGWIPDPEEVDRVLGFLHHPVFGVTADPIKDTGKGKVVLLHKALTSVIGGKFPIHSQAIGDCVSHGWGLGVDVLKAVQIVAGAREIWTGETATEIIYGGSRVEVGGGRLGNGDGSIGAWAAKAVSETIGTLVRGKYGSIDLTTYSGSTAKRMGSPRGGVPDELEPKAREHPVKTVSLVRTYEEARDAIANGYPVPVCSNRGFSSRRDEKGFARPSGSWAHCMLMCSVDDEDARPGVLIVNSWGENWISGPKRHDQPEGSFWCDASVADRMLSEQDSFAMSGFVGFPAQDLDFSGL